MNRIGFEVPGYPPAKSDGLLTLGADHPHASRIHLLLVAARQAQIVQVFRPIEEDWVGLDVMLLGATGGQDPFDVTSYLSGIVEVLGKRSGHGGIDHFGDLEHVWLYQNTHQIRDLTFRYAEASKTSYAITVRDLGHRDRRNDH
jgi:hypothetical protein